MKYIRKIKNVFVPLKETKLEDISIVPGDTILVLTDNNEPYGVCGAVYATQIDPRKQIEFKGIVKYENQRPK